MLSRSTWLIAVFVILGAAKIADVIWAKEIREFEVRTLDAWGIPTPVRVAGIGILLGLLGWRYYAVSKREAAQLGQPVIRRPVALFALGSLGLVLVLIVLASRR